MNCPGHVQIFKNGLKSYRDLPLKIAEFGKVHRFEPSGALHGLMRVRAFTQDDAHVFITEEQIAEESLEDERPDPVDLRGLRLLRRDASSSPTGRRSASATTRCGTRPRPR